MLANPTIQAARLRLARHYVQRIAEMSALFERGGENNVLALAQFDAERGQVEQWLAWLLEQAQHGPTPDDAQTLFVQLLREGDTLMTKRISFVGMLEYYRLALGFCEQKHDLASLAPLLFYLGYAHMTLGNPDEAKAVLARGLALSEQINDLTTQCYIVIQMATMAEDASQFDEAWALNERVIALAEQLGDRRLRASGLSQFGWLALRNGAWQQAQDYMQAAYDPIMRYGSYTEIANFWMKLGALARSLGDVAAAKQHYQQALEFSLRVGDITGSINHLMNVAVILDNAGEFATAQTHYLRALTLAQQMSLQRFEAIILGNLGYSSYLQGNFAEAFDYMQASMPLLRKQKLTYNLCYSLANLIPVCIQLGRFDEALAALREGFEIGLELEVEALQVMMLVAAIQTWLASAAAQGTATADAMLDTAAQWSGFVLACPITQQESRDEVVKLLPQMEVALGPERHAAALQHGETRVLAEVVAEVLRLI